MDTFIATRLIFTFFLHLTYGYGFVLWRLCNTLFTSRFVYVVIFAYNGPMAQATQVVVHSGSPGGSVDLTPQCIVILSSQEAAADQAGGCSPCTRKRRV